ncbi:MAG: glycosyltransferase family 1 protein [bacterium]|nr:glycosyltransferase family 1 protein [Candidatus Sumerlaeota bacterium]
MKFDVHYEAQRIFRPHPHGMDVVAMRVLDELLAHDEIDKIVVYTSGRPVPGRMTLDHPKLDWRCMRPMPYPVFEQIELPLAIRRSTRRGAASVHHFTSNTAPLALPRPAVITIHDVIYMADSTELSGSASAYQRYGRYYRRFIVPRVAHKAERIVTVSHYEKDNLTRALNLDPARVCVAHNGVSSIFFDPVNEHELRELLDKLGIERPYILFLANTDPKKNTGRTLRSFLAARKAAGFPHRLVMTDLPAHYWATLKRAVGTEGWDALCPLPFIPPHDLRALYAGASLYLYPSLVESFGLPLLEAMAAGAPVISSDTSAIPEIAGQHALLVNPRDEKALTAAIMDLIARPPSRSTLEAARRHAAEFTWARTASAVVSAYKSALAACARGGSA